MSKLPYKDAQWRQAMEIKFDFSNCMLDRVGEEHGLSWSELETAMRQLGPVHKDMARFRGEDHGDKGPLENHRWRNLHKETDVLRDLTAYARSMRRAVDAVLVLGIGGSALGTITLKTALLHPRHNELKRGARGGPRIYVVDNVDPVMFQGVLDVLDPNKTLVCVVSKSGQTVPTAGTYMVVRKWLRDAVGDLVHERMLFVTDPDDGGQRAIALRDGNKTFDIQKGVGGRFSVLSAGCLAPLAFTKINMRALMAGAAAMDKRCSRGRNLRENPAAMFAAVQFLLDTGHGKTIQVMMAYADRLKNVSDWFVQLWSESLGKARHLDGSPAHCGQTPIKAVGCTDQHSQVQLFVEGPFDKVVTFLTVDKHAHEIRVPDIHAFIPQMSYLRGHEFGEILNIKARATALALRDAKRPSCAIRLPEVNEYTLGQLLYLLEVATAYAGGLYNVNAFDQPGVEQGKRYTYGALGRADYEEYAEKLNKATATNPECVV